MSVATSGSLVWKKTREPSSIVASKLAVTAAFPPFGPCETIVVVVPGDTPLLAAETLDELVSTHVANSNAATLLTSLLDDPTGYGRVVRAGDRRVMRIVEQRDASPDELALGKVTARELDLGIGDELELSGAAGTGDYEIVGTVVVPTIGGNDGVGQGAVMTDAGFRRVDDEPETVLAAITLRDDAPTGTKERLAEQVGTTEAGSQDIPSSILNVARSEPTSESTSSAPR